MTPKTIGSTLGGGSAFWNGIIADHAASQLRATEPVIPTEPVPAERLYRGWEITWDYGFFTATSPDYDASWEGEEDGWVDNGQRVTARTRTDLEAEVDAWFEEHAADVPNTDPHTKATSNPTNGEEG